MTSLRFAKPPNGKEQPVAAVDHITSETADGNSAASFGYATSKTKRGAFSASLL
ncbi:MAG: hypothetical protein U0941_11175 [Planctomycetaceae bacterium]